MIIISTKQLQDMLKKREHFFLIDVRQKEELQYGMIPTAHHIPLHELEIAFAMEGGDFKHKYGFQKPDTKELLVFYCRTGSRSSIAASIVKRMGYVYPANYEESIWGWSAVDPSVRTYGPAPY